MNEDVYQKLWWGIIKWTLGIIISLAILGSLFWALFYSVDFANLPFEIPLRNWYQKTYWKIEEIIFATSNTRPVFFDPIYTFLPYPSTLEDTYTYAFWGTFSKFDTDNGTIYLKGHDGKTYSFVVGQDWHQLDNGTVDIGKFQYPPSIKNFEKSVINVDNTAYTDKSRISILWEDKRTLTQILKDYSKDPNVALNQNSIRFFSLTKFD